MVKRGWLKVLILLIFGMVLNGCTMLDAMVADAQAKQTDGKGGNIRVLNTTSQGTGSMYYVAGPSRSGNYRTTSVTSGSSASFSVDEDGLYIIYFRRVRDGEPNIPSRDENYRNWYSKSVHVSNDATVRVEIP